MIWKMTRWKKVPLVLHNKLFIEDIPENTTKGDEVEKITIANSLALVWFASYTSAWQNK